ncbi:hypothetical protein E2562_000139, partial [Oryza meyeriana var. granulata]
MSASMDAEGLTSLGLFSKEVMDASGKDVDLSTYKEKVLLIINVASQCYIDQFSRCLYVEYKSKGIDVQCQ